MITREWKFPPSEVISAFKENTDEFSVTYSRFFEKIIQSIETKGWVDIENDYYQLLKQCTENADCGYSVKELNEQLAFLQEKLIEYLGTIGTNQTIKEIHDAMIDFFDPADFSTEGKKRAMENIGLDIKSIEEVEYSLHLKNIFASGELEKDSVTEEISATASDGKIVKTDVVIAKKDSNVTSIGLWTLFLLRKILKNKKT